MVLSSTSLGFVLLPLLAAGVWAQTEVTGRVVDETGAGVEGARVELRGEDAAAPTIVSSDLAGNFKLILKSAGTYAIRAERKGYYLFQASAQRFENGANQLTIILNHQQEFSDRIDVTASPAPIDPRQPADRTELDNTEIQTIPFPAPQDYRSALQLFDGVVQDNNGRYHFNGARTDQTNYTLDGFNMSNPVTGQLDTRVNIDSIQAMEVQNSRFSAENGRGSAGVLDLKTKMGDDRFRFGGTNFIPGIASDGGWHVNKWTPRLELSGPLAKGRAWFHNGADVFYSDDTVHGLPRGENRTHGITGSDLTRFQVNLTPTNILTAGFLGNLSERTRTGLSFINPAETTTDLRQLTLMSSIRDQQYFGRGALLDLAFADTRGMLHTLPQGTELFQITPFGSRGNYFVNQNRHFYRQQTIANLFLPTLHLLGTHQLKFGIDFEREAFHQQTLRHDYEVLLADNSVARRVTFVGNPFVQRKNFEGAQYIQDQWNPTEGLTLEAGVRVEWNEIVRDLEVAPRISAAWAPKILRGTKFSAGWGVYHDAISLEIVSRQQDQTSLATFFLPDGVIQGPVPTTFRVDEHSLRTPSYQNTSVSVERKLPFDFYIRTGYTHRAGNRGFAFEPSAGGSMPAMDAMPLFLEGVVYALRNTRRDRYDAFDINLRRTFAGKFEWFAGYTRSRSRTSADVEYSLENPIFALQMPGALPWDAPNRFHMWGWAPVPATILPQRLRFASRNVTAAYLVEYRTGFPFNVVDQQGFLVGAPAGTRFPDYFSNNLHLEKQFRAIHYLWAWRFGFDNLSNNGNPNTVNNITGTPQFRTYGRGQARAFSVRLRFLGRR
jgi:hypothetical protein